MANILDKRVVVAAGLLFIACGPPSSEVKGAQATNIAGEIEAAGMRGSYKIEQVSGARLIRVQTEAGPLNVKIEKNVITYQSKKTSIAVHWTDETIDKGTNKDRLKEPSQQVWKGSPVLLAQAAIDKEVKRSPDLKKDADRLAAATLFADGSLKDKKVFEETGEPVVESNEAINIANEVECSQQREFPWDMALLRAEFDLVTIPVKIEGSILRNYGTAICKTPPPEECKASPGLIQKVKALKKSTNGDSKTLCAAHSPVDSFDHVVTVTGGLDSTVTLPAGCQADQKVDKLLLGEFKVKVGARDPVSISIAPVEADVASIARLTATYQQVFCYDTDSDSEIGAHQFSEGDDLIQCIDTSCQ
jgi:hypothetical protein